MIQSQILKNVEIFLYSIKNTNKKNLKSIKYIFKVENFIKIFTKFNFIKNRMEHSGNIFNLYFLICNSCFLLYTFIYLKKDSILGINYFNNAITLKNLQILSKKLISINFKNLYTKEKNLKIIKKLKKNSVKKLSMLNQLINKSIFILIQIKFNYQLSIFSFGFRSNTSCHTTLQIIHVYSYKIFGFIQFNFTNFVKKIHCKFIMQEIDSQIYDQKLLFLINQVLNLKYLSFYNFVNNNLNRKKTVFQTPNLNFLFFNIFFNRLDF